MSYPPPYGYPQQGYPPQGYPPQGYPPQGYPPGQVNPQGHIPPPGANYPPPQQGYPPPQGYPPQGFPPAGHVPQQGHNYPPQSYPGYPPQGYPVNPHGAVPVGGHFAPSGVRSCNCHSPGACHICANPTWARHDCKKCHGTGRKHSGKYCKKCFKHSKHH
jgi:U5 snRNP spliceosome subunit